MVPILGEKFSFTWIEYLFCFGEMSFSLCKCRYSGNVEHVMLDNILRGNVGKQQTFLIYNLLTKLEWSLFIRCSISFDFCINVVTFPWEIVDILGVLSFLSKSETPISLVAQYSNSPRIVAGGISNKLVFTVLAALVPNSTPMLIL
ncbi:unnamed protein product, partial [Porites lobata]